MKKVDYKKEYAKYYKVSSKLVEHVEVPEMNFLMIDGTGDPAGLNYKEAVEALFAVSYALKFMIKKSKIQIDYGVMPLEGLWWVDDMSKFSIDKKEDWIWTAMVMQPEIVTKLLVEVAIKQVKIKKSLKALSKIKFRAYQERNAAQIMHIGPFSEEGPTIQKLHDFISDNNGNLKGKHHEIYLSDIRRAAPEKWKTIIRQPYS